MEADFVEEDGKESEEHSDDDVGHQKSVPEPDSKVDLFVDYILQTKDSLHNLFTSNIST